MAVRQQRVASGEQKKDRWKSARGKRCRIGSCFQSSCRRRRASHKHFYKRTRKYFTIRHSSQAPCLTTDSIAPGWNGRNQRWTGRNHPLAAVRDSTRVVESLGKDLGTRLISEKGNPVEEIGVNDSISIMKFFYVLFCSPLFAWNSWISGQILTLHRKYRLIGEIPLKPTSSISMRSDGYTHRISRYSSCLTFYPVFQPDENAPLWNWTFTFMRWSLNRDIEENKSSVCMIEIIMKITNYIMICSTYSK